jgi:hypothetical protein
MDYRMRCIAACLCHLFDQRVVVQQLHRPAEPDPAACNVPNPPRQHSSGYGRVSACCSEQAVPQVLVVKERPQQQQVRCRLVLLADRLVRDGPRRPHTSIGVVLKRRVSQLVLRHQLAPLLLVEA